jgi:hypothetical protein
MIEVFLASATICFQGVCYPALVGRSTPRGEFPVQHQVTRLPGYGGEILTFKETALDRFAIHRTWRGREKLYDRPNAERVAVTNGCINVEPSVFAALLSCCASATVVIR